MVFQCSSLNNQTNIHRIIHRINENHYSQENHSSLTITKLGLREMVGYLVSRWEHAIERRFVSLLELFA